MEKHKKKQNGITLIALVITIIILLILAGITIVTLTGENGILNKANTAQEETKKKEYEEILKLIANDLRGDKIINDWNNKTYLDEFEKEISKQEKLKDAQINRINDETLIIVTKEKYVYKIVENDIIYIGKQQIVDIPTLEESTIKFTYNPSPKEKEWTNQNVEVNIETSDTQYQLQYSLNNTNWKSYRFSN